MKLDIGCGKNKVKEAVGIDINKISDADVLSDIQIGHHLKMMPLVTPSIRDTLQIHF